MKRTLLDRETTVFVLRSVKSPGLWWEQPK